MCILIVKPAGVKAPDKDTLKKCFEENPDGAGVAYASDGVLRIKKGLMLFDDFLKAVEKIPLEAPALIHARIGTSGAKDRSMTHPFLLTSDEKALKRTTTTTNTGVAVGHNGIFGEFGKRKDINDTCEFIINYLQPLQELAQGSGTTIFDDRLTPVIEKLTGTSKIALLSADGHVKRFGDGWSCRGGCYYSNLTWTYTHYTCLTDSDYYKTWWKTHRYDPEKKMYIEITPAEKEEQTETEKKK